MFWALIVLNNSDLVFDFGMLFILGSKKADLKGMEDET